MKLSGVNSLTKTISKTNAQAGVSFHDRMPEAA